MSFITGHTVFWRLVILALLIVSMVGPWMFEVIPVPAQLPCDMPAVRLYGDFCGYPRSGFETVTWVASGFFDLLDELVKGNFAARISALMFLLGVLVIMLPFLSNVLPIGKRNSHRLQIINVIVWGMACLPTLTMFILQSYRGQFVQFLHLLWGLGLYVLLAIGAIIVEILVLRLDIKPSMATQTRRTNSNDEKPIDPNCA